ncbi:MAG: serine hydrolase domain-containing protein [Pseudomonadota bacterium]
MLSSTFKRLIILPIAGLISLAISACSLTSLSPVPAEHSVTSNDVRVQAFENGLVPIDQASEAQSMPTSIFDRMGARGVPGVGIAILHEGQLIFSGGYGRLTSTDDGLVDGDTVFSAGSVSKVVNAVLVMRLVEAGILDLDTNIVEYLSSWQIPENELTENQPVTLRHLLAHTSGFSVHGFQDYLPGSELPSTTEILNGSGPAKNKPVEILFTPGTSMKYSGGGVTVIQAIIEDVMKVPYESAAKQYVFDPVGMTRSRFRNPLPETHGNIAKSHNKRGKPRALPRGYESMPEVAASGLWTSATDMGLLLQALLSDETFLNSRTRQQFWTQQSNSWHGLGPRINGNGDELIVHHGGANDHFKSWMEFHPSAGTGVIILTNGEDGRLLSYEIRVAIGEAFGWFAKFPEDYNDPEFQ